MVVGCWYLVEDSKLPNTNNPRTITHDQQPTTNNQNDF